MIVDTWISTLRSLHLTTKAALALVALGVILLIWNIGPIFSSMFKPGLSESAARAGDNGASVSKFAATLASNEQLFVDRSIFFKPAAPPPPPHNESPHTDNTPIGPQPPPPYSGPKLIGFIGSQAIFDRAVNGDKNTIAVGQKVGNLELVAIDRWVAKVKYNDHPYDLNLFDTVGLGVLAPGMMGNKKPAAANIFGQPPRSGPQRGSTTATGTAATSNDGSFDLGGNDDSAAPVGDNN